MNIKKSLSVVLVLTIICSCCVLLLSCSSPNEDKQETITAIVEQTATPETIGTSFEYDPEGDKVPDIPMHVDYDTRIIIKDFLDNPGCEGKMYERLCEIYRAVNALDISKTEHYYESSQDADIEPILRTSVRIGSENHWVFFSKVGAGTFVVSWNYANYLGDDYSQRIEHKVCSVKIEDGYICQLITEFMQDVDEWYWSGEPEGWWESH